MSDTSVMVSLIGEQPIPNLLPFRYQEPCVAVLVHSELTERAAGRLERLLPSDCTTLRCLVPAYDIAAIRNRIVKTINLLDGSKTGLLFNLTGGTKAMSLAAYLAAIEKRADFLYLQSEGRQTRLYRYASDAAGRPHMTEDRLLHGMITIDDYLRAFVDEHQPI